MRDWFGSGSLNQEHVASLMQTLNVGAGRTDEEYRAAEEQRRADLQSEARTDAHYFFVAAVLAALGAGLLLIRLNVVVSIGAIDLLDFYAADTIRLHPLLGYAAGVAWVAIVIGLGFAAQIGQRWAFLAGVALYGIDMIALAITFSWIAMGVHGFFIFKWFQGQRILQELKDTGARAGTAIGKTA